MNWMEFVLGLLTLVLGTGWLFTWRSHRREASGKATQAEAGGWAAMQALYEKTIADFDGYSELMRKERQVLISENNELRENYKKIEADMINVKRQLARQGRKLEAISPFLCSVVGCKNRKKVNIGLLSANDDNQDIIDEQNAIDGGI